MNSWGNRNAAVFEMDVARSGRSRSAAGRLLALCLGACLVGCATRHTAAPMVPDRPVPTAEPRAMLVVRLDLPLSASPSCEEVFDLALYADRAVDLITWDESHRRCSARIARIRYLSRRISRETLWTKIRELSLKSEVLSK